MIRGNKREQKLINLSPGMEGTISWKYVGGSTITWGGHLIKNGQTFLAHPQEVPMGFRDVVIPTNGMPSAEVKEPLQVVKPESTYKVEQRDDESGAWDVIDITGKRINENPMTELEAHQLLEVL